MEACLLGNHFLSLYQLAVSSSEDFFLKKLSSFFLLKNAPLQLENNCDYFFRLTPTSLKSKPLLLFCVGWDLSIFSTDPDPHPADLSSEGSVSTFDH